MPAWWKGKLKSPGSWGSGSGRSDEAKASKEKARSFDEAAIRGNAKWIGDRSPLTLDLDYQQTCHPLPMPLVPVSPSPRPSQTPATGSGSASASSSSLSSSATDDAGDLGFRRFSEPVNVPKNSPISELSLSPKKPFQLHSSKTSVEASPSGRSKSPTSGSRGYNFNTSPRNTGVFSINPGSPNGSRDDWKGSHPLPLPPSSPPSLSRCLRQKWKKGKLLGKGTFGHVFQGFNSESGQMCAIKEVKVISDDKDSSESLKQLSQEISLLSQFSHPNIVQYYGSELDDDTLSVYLEYVSGGSIHKLLREYGPFSEPVIQSYAAQILSGLAYLHGRDTVHRDIKGANILVDPNGVVKLADFGMAKHISAHNSIHSFKGSPYWMAPEVIMTTSGYNLSVDIWSFGCTIIEMATSKPPWCQYEGVAAIFKIVNSKDVPEIPSHLSRDGKDFLRLCLQREPAARPSAAQLMDHPFVRDQATTRFGQTIFARDLPPSSSDQAQTPPRNRRTGLPQWQTLGSFPVTKSPSDLAGARINLSLPVSPCSSPLRSFRQSNWSCLPSPQHPSFPGVGSGSGGLGSYSANPGSTGRGFLDPWMDLSLGRTQSPYESPKRW